MEVPANVDEVAMINNIKEEKEHFSASQDNEALVIGQWLFDCPKLTSLIDCSTARKVPFVRRKGHETTETRQ
jgi:hypothetical protein